MKAFSVLACPLTITLVGCGNPDASAMRELSGQLKEELEADAAIPDPNSKSEKLVNLAKYMRESAGTIQDFLKKHPKISEEGQTRLKELVSAKQEVAELCLESSSRELTKKEVKRLQGALMREMALVDAMTAVAKGEDWTD